MTIRLVLMLLLVLGTSFHCEKKKVPTATECQVVENVSFQKDIVPIFEAHCVSCHSGANASGNLNLESSVAYMSLSDPKSGYLDTINPSFSLLYASMVSTSNPMPPNGKLDKCTTDLILKWIQQKAKNN
jgi:hypothetical protein